MLKVRLDPPSPRQESGAPIRILLLEDTPTTTMIVKAYLDAVSPGAEVVAADTLAGALQRIAQGGFDLVLADLNLPDSAGLATLARLVDVTDRLVIVITSDDDENLREACCSLGAYDFLHKTRLSKVALGRILRLATMQANTYRSLRELNRTLEQRVAERTAELQAAYREMESFSYSVSHDLAAPLRAIAGLTGILREDHGPCLAEDARGLLDRLESAAKRMGGMIAGLLEFSRTGRTPVARAPVDMSALVDEVLAESRAAGSRRATVMVGSLPPALGDAVLLRQVWQNLIGNALKFSAHAAAPRVEIGARAAGERIEYWVRDNGAGFDMCSRDRLFGVFQRAHSPSEFEGSGAGLAIVRRIVERHGGAVDAVGAPGRGAEFRFAIDAAPRAAVLMVAPSTAPAILAPA